MKQSGRCPKCTSTRVGLLPEVFDMAQGFRTTRHLVGKMGMWKVQTEAAVEAYICTDCGYFEEYVKAPGEVAWHEVEGFQYVREEGAEQGPYRSE